MDWSCSLHGEMNACRNLVRKRGHWCTYEENIKIYVKQIRCENVNWIHFPQYRVVDSCEYENELLSSVRGEEYLV
jgi:hypothetical protein